MMDDDILRFRIYRIIRLKRTDDILILFMRCDLSGRSRIPVRMNDQRAEAILGRHPSSAIPEGRFHLDFRPHKFPIHCWIMRFIS